MELKGTIRKISEVQTFASGFQKSEMVLLTDEQYPQPINIEFLQDKSDMLAYLTEGSKVKVGINIRGREWTSPNGEVKYFNSIVGWRIEKLDEEPKAAEPTQAKPLATGQDTAKNENPFADDEDDDDLPF